MPRRNASAGFMVVILLWLLVVTQILVPGAHAGPQCARQVSTSRLYQFPTFGSGSDSGGLLSRMKKRFDQKPVEEKTENDKMREALETKPWRAPKPKYLTYEYRPWKDSWKERYRTTTTSPDMHMASGSEDTAVMYGVPQFRPSWDRTRVNELWFWPWLWTKAKVDRLSWIHKVRPPHPLPKP